MIKKLQCFCISFRLKRKVREFLRLYDFNGVKACKDLREWLTPERIEKYTKCGFMKPSDSYQNTYPHCNRLITQLEFCMHMIKEELRQRMFL
jgi:hypothetical protein